MHIVLFDTPKRKKLYPLTLTRAVGDLRFGILTIKERWEHLTKKEVFIITEPFLQSLYTEPPVGDCIFIDATVLPSTHLLAAVINLSLGEFILDDEDFVAGRIDVRTSLSYGIDWESSCSKSLNVPRQKRVEYPHQIFQWNDEFIRFDFSLITTSRLSATHGNSVGSGNTADIFIEEGTNLSHSYLNASGGPIYIGKNVTIMEGCMLRGPIALCEGSVVKMGAKLYGATTVGPNCVVGGEMKNSVLVGNSNKAHDGYLGDSVIGEWCNLGAGTTNSNVKNTGGDVKQWDHFDNALISTGNKCGVIMGDHSKTAINTSINTGTMIGVCSNVFGHGLTPKLIRDFSWGMEGTTKYKFDKALEDIANWKKMKGQLLSDRETKVLKHIFDNSGN